MQTNSDSSKQIKKQGAFASMYRGLQIPIHAKLMLAFVLMIVSIGAIFLVIGVQLTGNRVVAEAQDKVRNDLNAARVIYVSQLQKISAVVCYTADRDLLREAVPAEDMDEVYEELIKVGNIAGLDMFGVTNKYGKVLLRVHNPTSKGDDLGHHGFIQSAMHSKGCVTSTILFSQYELEKESSTLAEQAHITLIDTPLARPLKETEVTSGMMLEVEIGIVIEEVPMALVLHDGVMVGTAVYFIQDHSLVFEGAIRIIGHGIKNLVPS